MTVPNYITIARFLAVPAIIYALLHGYLMTAFVGFLAAGISDALDGTIARHFNSRSDLGTWMDPVADKLLLVSVFIVLGWMEHLPDWLVLLVITRDVLIVGAVILSSLMGQPLRLSPIFVSKANTAAQIVLVVAVLAMLAGVVSVPGFIPAMIAVTAALTIASALSYFVIWIRHVGQAE
jgi:cardiolipin synthase (CMP-forming)